MTTTLITLFPTEVWLEITTLACVDGSFTGRSLALSCKYLRVQTFAGRFHSLSLRSLVQLGAFLSYVQDHQRKQTIPSGESEWRPAVHHLWLTTLNDAKTTRWTSYKSPYEATSSTRGVDYEEESKASWDICFLTAVDALLPLVAPSLRTLVLGQTAGFPLPPFSLALPHLEELTLLGPPSTLLHDPSSSSLRLFYDDLRDACAALRERLGDRTTPHLPALQRLHLCMYGAPDVRTALLADPAFVGPSLTHLRLSCLGVSEEQTAFPHALAHALGVAPPLPFFVPSLRSAPEDPGSPDALRARGHASLAGLRHLVLHGIEPTVGFSGNSQMVWGQVLIQLEDVADRADKILGLRVVLMNRPNRNSFQWEKRLREDWVERMEGGKGCWVDSEAEEERREGPPDPVVYEPYTGF